MAQASSFKSSIRYQVCDSNNENGFSRLVAVKPTDRIRSNDLKSDSHQINTSPQRTTSNHYGSLLIHSLPKESNRATTSSSIESTIVHIPSEVPTCSKADTNHNGRSSLTKEPNPILTLEHTSGRSPISSRIHLNTLSANNSSTVSKQSLVDPLGSHTNTAQKDSSPGFPSTPAIVNHDNTNLSIPSQAGLIRQAKTTRKARRQEIKARFEKFDLNSNNSRRSPPSRRFTFIFDPSGRLTYWWTSIISLAFLYNFWAIIFRFSFHELTSSNLHIWFVFDYSCDFLYLMDIMFNFRTAYLEEGVLQTDPIKLRHYYMNTTRFYIDCLCLMPLDFLYLSIGFKSIVRCFRLVKIYRFWTFLDRTERHTNYPNLFRTIVMIHYLLAIFHWNACLIYILHTRSQSGITKRFSFTHNDTGLNYFKALYWSIAALTLSQNHEFEPTSKEDYIFLSVELIFALLLFATIMGHVASIVSNLSNARKDFQAKLDAVKTYMSLRRVPNNLEDRVIRWFDYLWMSHKSADDNQVLSLLPYKLRAEIAIHVHLDTLKRVEIFQNTEAGFLNELVLRLKPVLFSPGDFICRKGEVGREMYIVNRGKLHVMADNNKTVLATLKAGSYFGEISILNMGSGNRRTASVRSVGYSDLFCLSKEDLWEVLKEYPAVRVKLESIAVKRLEKHKKPLIQQINLKRSKSAPGILEIGCHPPLHAPICRSVSGVDRPSCLNGTNSCEVQPTMIVPIENEIRSSENLPLGQEMNSCNSLISTAPLASSISFSSSMNSTQPPLINHSISWSTASEQNSTLNKFIERTNSLTKNEVSIGKSSSIEKKNDQSDCSDFSSKR